MDLVWSPKERLTHSLGRPLNYASNPDCDYPASRRPLNARLESNPVEWVKHERSPQRARLTLLYYERLFGLFSLPVSFF